MQSFQPIMHRISNQPAIEGRELTAMCHGNGEEIAVGDLSRC
jgi:hypothetical protein